MNDMDINLIIANLWVLVIAFAIIFYAIRYRSRRKKGFYPTYSGLGRALQQLQQIAQPKMEYVLQEKLKDSAEEDEAGGPKDPTQARHH